MAWMVPEQDLDYEQRNFLNSHLRGESSNVWIKGHAGSGKSVLLGHSVKDALQKRLNVAVVVYTHALIDLLRTGLAEIGITNVPIMTYYEFKNSSGNYDIIFVDEIQDIPSYILKQMRQRSQRIIGAGDQLQSIYADGASPEEIKTIVNGQIVELLTIHRLTRSLIKLVSLFMANVGNILQAKVDARSVDVQIKVCNASTPQKEVNYVWTKAKSHASRIKPTAILLPRREEILDFCDEICILEGKRRWSRTYDNQKRRGRNNFDFNDLNRFLSQNGVQLEYVGSSYGSLDHAVKNRNTILMTYHSAKGLDFENVFMPRLTRDFSIPTGRPKNGRSIDQETVFMVGLTRSRNNLFLTHTGIHHHFLDKFIKDPCVVSIDIDRELGGQTSGSNENTPLW